MMFAKMRRSRQQMSHERTEEILKRHTAGVLSLFDANGYPYGVPISYVYTGDTLYFHSALVGHKIDAVKNCDKASFTVIDQNQVVPEEYTTYFRSVIVFGHIRILEDDNKKRHAIEILAEHFAPNDKTGRLAEIDKLYKAFVMLELQIEHVTGKEAKELVKKHDG